MWGKKGDDVVYNSNLQGNHNRDVAAAFAEPVVYNSNLQGNHNSGGGSGGKTRLFIIVIYKVITT